MMAGTWSGTGSDAGTIQWAVTQDGSSFSGTVTIFNVPTWNPSVVQGTLSGTVDEKGGVSFQQSICLGPLGTNGPCEVTVLTNGNLKLQSDQLSGDYLGREQSLRSAPGPLGVGTNPFVKGSIILKRIGN
jgi:hypothetical protein